MHFTHYEIIMDTKSMVYKLMINVIITYCIDIISNHTAMHENAHKLGTRCC